MREQWILDRNDTEQLKEVTSEYGISVLLTIASTTSASSTSSCLAVLRLASISPRWLMPRRAS